MNVVQKGRMVCRIQILEKKLLNQIHNHLIGWDETYTCSLQRHVFFPNQSIILIFYAFEIFCRVFNDTTIKLEYAKLLAKSILQAILTYIDNIRTSSWENRFFAYAKTKTQISFAVTAKLISAFVFATRIVQSLFYLTPKFQASSHIQWLHSPVCVGSGRKPRKPVSHNEAHMILWRIDDDYLFEYGGVPLIFKPRCEKTGRRGFRPGPTQTRLYNQTRWLEAWNFVYRK